MCQRASDIWIELVEPIQDLRNALRSERVVAFCFGYSASTILCQFRYGTAVDFRTFGRCVVLPNCLRRRYLNSIRPSDDTLMPPTFGRPSRHHSSRHVFSSNLQS